MGARSKSFRVWRTAPVLAALLAAACTVGPDYKRPEVAAPPQFRAQIGPSDASSLADLPWWSVFNDKELQGLITHALAHNYDLQVAVSRIEQARSLVAVAASEGKPQVGYDVSAGGAKVFAPSQNSAGTTSYGALTGVFNAAWELDVWGRIRRSTESAEANLLSQEYVRRGVILTLVSDLAADYFQLLELDRELAIAQDSSDAYRRTLDLFTDRFKAGKDSELPVQRTQAIYDFANVDVSRLKRQIGQLEDAISVLAGDYPRDIARGGALADQTMPPTPLGQTTDLLLRRPDIRQAEEVMVQANAEIGVAVANFYPRVGLSALVGGTAAGTEHSFNAVSLGNLFADVAGPIFTGGRLEAIYQQRKAFWDEAVAEYRKTVQAAFQETSDALIAQQTLVKQRQDEESQIEALRKSVDTAFTRYDAGRSSYFEVLEAEQQLYPAEFSLAQTQRDQLLAVVSLYKALGGGWKLTDQDWSQPK